MSTKEVLTKKKQRIGAFLTMFLMWEMSLIFCKLVPFTRFQKTKTSRVQSSLFQHSREHTVSTLNEMIIRIWRLNVAMTPYQRTITMAYEFSNDFPSPSPYFQANDVIRNRPRMILQISLQNRMSDECAIYQVGALLRLLYGIYNYIY